MSAEALLSSSSAKDYSPQVFSQDIVDREISHQDKPFDLPKTAQELQDRLLNVSHLKRIQDWMDLTSDLCYGLSQRESLAAKMQMSSPEVEDKVEGVTILWNSGLGGWKGSRLMVWLSQFNRPVQRFFEGTYHEPEEYMKSKGYKVREVWGKTGIQTGDLEDSSRALDEAIHEESYDSDLIVILGHSFGGLVAQDYAARNPDEAQRMIFVSGGAPFFPDAVNYWVAGTVLLLHGMRNYGRLRRTAEFMQSEQAKKIRFVNLKDRNDRVFDGPHTPGVMRVTTTGHSGIYYDTGNLDFVDLVVKSEIVSWRNREKYGRGGSTFTPVPTAA